MKKNILFTLFFFLNLVSCSTTEPPPPDETKPVLTLSFDKKSCTELWIKLTTKDLTLPAELTLKQYNPTGDSLFKYFILTSQDSLLYVDSLLPNQIYNFQLSCIWNPASGNQQQVSSIKQPVTTMDTTSHNFTFTAYEFGEPLTGYSSILYGVAIIDENNIWAVGEIYVNDSLGQTLRYNAVHWNGSDWTISRLPYIFQGQPFYHPIQSVYAFSENDIWFCGNGVIHWDGNNYVPISIPSNIWGPYQMNKLWGTSSSNLYVVGNAGNIAHYNGSQWTRVESGTELALTDVYGKNENEVYAVGINVQEVKGVVLKGNSNGFSVMINSGIINQNELFDKLYGDLASVWLDDNGTLYAGGNLLYRYNNGEWDYVRSLPENFIGGNPGAYYRGALGSIRGNASNDYIIAGDRNTLKHFNGISWEQIGLPYSPSSPIGWTVEQKGNIAVGVGLNANKAFIIKLTK